MCTCSSAPALCGVPVSHSSARWWHGGAVGSHRVRPHTVHLRYAPTLCSTAGIRLEQKYALKFVSYLYLADDRGREVPKLLSYIRCSSVVVFLGLVALKAQLTLCHVLHSSYSRVWAFFRSEVCWGTSPTDHSVAAGGPGIHLARLRPQGRPVGDFGWTSHAYPASRSMVGDIVCHGPWQLHPGPQIH